MLNKVHTLTTKEVKQTLTKGKKIETQHFIARFINDNEFSIAVNVSKKVSKKAVIRNRIKRRIKSALLSLPNINKARFVINVKKIEVVEMSFEEIKKELSGILKTE